MAEPVLSYVTYLVDGVADSIDITIATPTGMSQQNGLAVPLVGKSTGRRGLSFRFRPGTPLYLSVQNMGRGGGITCRIEVDGRPVSENTATGSYVIA